MTDVEVQLGALPVGTFYRHSSASGERVSFRYAEQWLVSPERFAIDPELFLDPRTTTPARGGLFGALSDCAPDRWGRQLMQRRERRAAEAAGRAVRTLSELDYLLGVSDESRLGALRFRVRGSYVAADGGVPPLVRLGALLDAAGRIERDEDAEEDLALLVAPGSSLGGARPKASILDQRGRLSIAKFPREGDEYSVERWEWVALKLAQAAGIQIPDVELVGVAGREVLLSRRFDRVGRERVHFASALTLLGLRDGDRASYPEIAEILQRDGSQPRADCEQLFRRMVFNIVIANVDDHLRNHGFLRQRQGWTLSPAFDLNPVPADLRPRVLSTNITLDDATGSLTAARQSATYFDLSSARADAIIGEVHAASARWRSVAKASGASQRECQRMQSAFLTS
ncbi:MAG TPA: HipA domain-containing protein [Polyangiaceae bacterium]|nr:HipA domain-containing protein [Polyangiaceae bacterium]